MALIAVLLILMVVSGLAVALTTGSKVEVALADNEEVYAGARAAAESGLNRAVAVVLANSGTTTVQQFLNGPDGSVNNVNLTASVNADNGSLAGFFGGASPWRVRATDPNYTYEVKLFDDDDPTLYTQTLSAGALTAMTENNTRFTDQNSKLVVRAIGHGPRNTAVTLDTVIVPLDVPAILVNGDMTVAGHATVQGAKGSVHANGNLTIEDNSVSISQNATASGAYTDPAGWSPGGVEGGSMPQIPVPNINARDYYTDADFVLTTSTTPGGGGYVRLKVVGATTDAQRASGAILCNASVNNVACKATYGWSYSPPSGWLMNANSGVSGTYFVFGTVNISGSPGSTATPMALSVIATGSIQVTGSPKLTPEPTSRVQFVTDGDLKIAGTLVEQPAVEGRNLVREQIEIIGNPTLAGQFIVQNVPSVDNLVTANLMSGSATVTYNGTLSNNIFTATGFREATQ
jgi:hypothetical protein